MDAIILDKYLQIFEKLDQSKKFSLFIKKLPHNRHLYAKIE